MKPKTRTMLAFLWTIGVFSPSAFADGQPKWEPVTATVTAGKAVRLELRLLGTDGTPVRGPVSVSATRLDMAPDGMAAMTAPLRPLPAPGPGLIAFETDLIMAGRWQVTITGTADGVKTPVSGSVVFTASERRTEAATTPAEARTPKYYRNPMGLPDVSPVPKKDSMGMDYIPVFEDDVAGPAGTIRLSPEKIQRAGVRTEVVARRSVTRTVRAAGSIVPQEARLAIVTARFGGFVEELLVSTTGTEVRPGTPLARIWIESPEILRKQADYLTALRGTSGRVTDIAAAEGNLRLFGFPDAAIEQVRRQGEPLRSITLTAPARGTVLDKPAMVGMRFQPGDVLFRTADLSSVWVMAQVSERDIAALRVGQVARIMLAAYPDRTIEGKVGFIYPEFDMATRTARVRIDVPNPDGRLRTGLYADVGIDSSASDGQVLAIPISAVIDSGRRKVAFVAGDNGRFEPRDLLLGGRGNGFVEVRKGLAEGERIVTSGNFLIDAESNLQAALAAFTTPAVTP